MSWEEMNRRRHELIDSIINKGPLSPDDEAELKSLQEQMLAHQQDVAPIPMEKIRETHTRMQASRIEQLEEEIADQTNWIWKVCGALGIPADASSGKALDAIAELRHERD